MSKKKLKSEKNENTSIIGAYQNEELKSLRKKTKKELRKKEKKERKEIDKIRSKVIENFPLKNQAPNVLVDAVRLNKALMKKDEERNKAWRGEYYEKLFAEFKNLIIKHNDGLNLGVEKLIGKADRLKREIVEHENKLKKLKEVSKLLKEDE